MKNTRIAHRYAKALFDLAIEQNIIEKVYEDVLLINEVCQNNKIFINVLSSPIIRSDKKQSILKELFQSKIHPVTLSFLLILTKKRREYFVTQIAIKYIDFYKEYKGIEVITIVSADKLDEPTKQKILQKLKSFIYKELELIEVIDPKIIGGFIIQYNDKKYDASILSKVNALSRNFLTNEYIREF